MSDASQTVYNGRYALQRQLARGGMADVFLAHDELLDRAVAVKVLFPEFASDPAFVERFRREAQAAANLNHPNIVGVYDWGHENDTYFIVMEYIEGRSLADVIRSEGPIPSERAVEITADVASALSFAHRNGLVHRDVKPGNVLVTPSGQVKVADFGIATAANAGNANLTRTGLVMGTATYFSPEQAQGKPVDPRSDLYSLGVVLYEMLAGVPPFSGDNPVAIAYQHVQETPPGLRARGVPVNDALEAITFKLLAKNPAHRYPTADDLRADLRRYSEGMHRLAQAQTPVRAAPAAAGAAATTAMAATSAMRAAPAETVAAAAPTRGGGSGSRSGLYAVLAALGLIVLAGIMVIVLTRGNGDPSTPTVAKVSVPVLTNRTQADAEAVLRGLNLVPSVVLEENLDVEAGKVFRQNPTGGSKVDPNTEVVLTVSKGKNTVAMPNVVGSAVEDAEAKLRSADYQLDVALVPDPNSTLPAGQVLKQAPTAGERVPIGTKATLTYSAPEAKEIPDVAGQTIATATINLRDFTVAAADEASDTVEAGKVIRTDPPAGTKAPPKSSVKVYVSSGLPKVLVDQLVNLKADSAKALLDKAGLRYDFIFVTVEAGSPQIGVVTKQSVPANTSVPKGTLIVLTVATGPATTTTVAPSPTTTKAPTATTTTAARASA